MKACSPGNTRSGSRGVSSSKKLAARLRKAGVTFTHGPVKQPWGGWVADFLDPDGNELEVVHHPDHYATGKT